METEATKVRSADTSGERLKRIRGLKYFSEAGPEAGVLWLWCRGRSGSAGPVVLPVVHQSSSDQAHLYRQTSG